MNTFARRFEVLACCQVIVRRITQDNQDNSPEAAQEMPLWHVEHVEHAEVA